MKHGTGTADGKAVSLHRRILSEIRARILSGEWQPGRRIPFEHELSVEYGCSRMTVNKAMSELAKSGLIERRRRSGSFVSRPRSQAAVLEIHDIRAEVQALGLPYRYQLSSRRTRTATEADEAEAGFAAGSPLLDLVCRHFAGEQPFCLEERTISLAAVPEAADESFEDTAPGPWLLGRIPWSAAEHTIRAEAASDAVAVSLRIPRNSACLVVQRRTWSADLPVTNVLLTYAGQTHSLVARFAPQRG
jgi:GntR family histidine utilization transcriptional repressor